MGGLVYCRDLWMGLDGRMAFLLLIEYTTNWSS